MALLEEGAAIRDTYEIERFLGEGAFAEVYRVRHRYLGRQALKLFKLPGLTLSLIHIWERIVLQTIARTGQDFRRPHAPL